MWVSYHSHRLDICHLKGAKYRSCHRISQCSVFWVCAHTPCVWSLVIFCAMAWPVSVDQETLLLSARRPGTSLLHGIPAEFFLIILTEYTLYRPSIVGLNHQWWCITPIYLLLTHLSCCRFPSSEKVPGTSYFATALNWLSTTNLCLKAFFQRACRIVIGPPKHVLHLVWNSGVLLSMSCLQSLWQLLK